MKKNETFHDISKRALSDILIDCIEKIQDTYYGFALLVNAQLKSRVISLKQAIDSIILLCSLKYDISLLPASAEDFSSCDWENLEKKYNKEISNEDLRILYPSARKMMGEGLYNRLLILKNTLPYHKYTFTLDTVFYKVIGEDDAIPMGSSYGLKTTFDTLRQILLALELIFDMNIISSRIYQAPSYINNLSRNNTPSPAPHPQKDLSQDNLKKLFYQLMKYKEGMVESGYLKNERLLHPYENQFMTFDCYETSNKHGLTSKMWSLIFYPKKDFKHLANYINLSKITKIKITKVRNDTNGRWAIRFYDMTKNPTPEIVRKILAYIFYP